MYYVIAIGDRHRHSEQRCTRPRRLRNVQFVFRAVESEWLDTICSYISVLRFDDGVTELRVEGAYVKCIDELPLVIKSIVLFYR